MIHINLTDPIKNVLKWRPVGLNKLTVGGNGLDGDQVALQEPRVALDGGREPTDPLRQRREHRGSLIKMKSKPLSVLIKSWLSCSYKAMMNPYFRIRELLML